MRKRSVALLLLFAMMALLLAGCGKTTAAAKDIYRSIEDLQGKRIGVQTGTVFDVVAREQIPACEVVYFNAATDLPVALESGKIDAYFNDEAPTRLMLEEYPSQTILEIVYEDNFGYIFPKNDPEAEKHCRQMNEFLAKIRADGTLAEIEEIWFSIDESRQLIDTASLTGENGTLTMITEGSYPPFSSIVNGAPGGYDVDIAARFCREYGYDLEVVLASFDGMLSAVAGGKADFGASGISITEERKETMLFSDPNYTGGAAIIVKKEQSAVQNGTVSAKSIEDLRGKTIGVQTGTVFDEVAREKVPDCEVVYFNSTPDLPVALENGKIDAYFADEPPAKIMLREYPSHTILTKVYEDNYGIIFPKQKAEAEEHCRQMNEFLAKIKADGTLAEIEEIWFGADESRQRVDMSSLTGENGTLHFITEGTYPPYNYVVNGEMGGYEVDIVARFCREYGYALQIETASFEGLLASVSAGKADFGASGISITEERKETMLFSEPEYSGGAVIVVKKGQDAAQNSTASNTSIEDLRGKTIGVLSGSVHDKIAEDGIPGCRVEYFNAMTDLPLALENGKIDAYLNEEPVSRVLIREYPAQSAIGTLEDADYGFMFPKNNPKAEKLCQQLSEYLAEIKADGTLQEIDAIWFGEDESLKKVDYSFTGENGTVVLATDPSLMPFSYLVGEDIGGYDIDIAARFCRKYGYQLEVVPSAFSGVLAGLSSGKFDCAACCITITEEREESFLFSEPDYVGGIVVVAKTDAKDEVGYSIAESFRKTFLREDRWKLFVRGIGVTLTITLLSCLFGTALGFLLFLVYRKEYKALNLILDGIMNVLGKSPIVVILMILFYIIFGSSELSGLWVSVIGFSVLFAFSFVGIVKVGVSAVDPGQVEASLALGFTDTQTFLHVTLPQAARLFLPGYKNNIVSLLKDTAVVGYVTVQDLTKVSDIVRSRTYEAFFPLIATAIIYFLLAGCLTQLVRRLEFGADPTHRSPEKILKGVERK